MKTWEMIKKLGENPEKEFKREDGLVISTSIDDTLLWESGYTHLNIHDEWEEVKEPVSFMEGIERAVEYFRELMKEDVDTLGYRKYFYFDLSIEALQKQIPKMVDFKHERGDEVALITCPICNRSIIANLERYEEFTKKWYCKKCGQLLALEES